MFAIITLPTAKSGIATLSIKILFIKRKIIFFIISKIKTYVVLVVDMKYCNNFQDIQVFQ